MPVLQNILESKIKDFGDNGKICVSLFQLNEESPNSFSVNADSVVPAASIIKLCILASVMQRIENNDASFSDSISIEEGDMFGDFDAQHHPLRANSYSIGDLCRLMIDLSDNLASNMLIRFIGMEQINRDISSVLGLKNTVLQRKFLDFKTQSLGLENYTTANDAIQMLMYFINREKQGSKVAAEMLKILNAQCDKNYLSQYMPDGFSFAHKTGHISGSMHNVGIITTPSKKKFVVAVMMTNLKSDVEGLRFLNSFGESIFTCINR